MAVSNTDLSQYAQYLKNAAPQEFEGFVNAFSRHTDQLVYACAVAPAADVLLVQGRAQHAMKALQILQECDKRPAPTKI